MGKEFFSYLKCRECGRHYPKKAVHVCEFDFGPLEADYNYDYIRHSISRSIIESRPHSMWRYRELLPIDGLRNSRPSVSTPDLPRWSRRLTPLLARGAGRLRELYVKERRVQLSDHSHSRIASLCVALSRAKELGFQIVACASTPATWPTVSPRKPRVRA